MQYKKRNPCISALLSFLIPGLGQMYNTQLTKGIIYNLACMLFSMAFMVTVVLDSFRGAVAFVISTILITIFIIIDAVAVSIKKKQVQLKQYNRWYFYTLFLIIAVVISMAGEQLTQDISNYKTYKISSGSMLPSVLVRDHVIVKLNAYKNDAPQRGDIIVFMTPEDEGRDHPREFIMRVVGVGEDTVMYRDKQLIVNGEPVNEPYTQKVDPEIRPLLPECKGYPWETLKPIDCRDNFGPITVPEGTFFVMGDNRDSSYDSRVWGFVDRNLIKGKALYIYWSWDNEAREPRLDRIGKPFRYALKNEKPLN